MTDPESDSGLDHPIEVAEENPLAPASPTASSTTAPSTQPPPRKRGRPRKQVDPNAIVEKPPKQPKKPVPPRIPKRTLNSLEPKNLVSFSSEDIEHVRTIQRRIQTCIHRNIKYLQALPE